jgi:outer membrane protein assembly factor BamB
MRVDDGSRVKWTAWGARRSYGSSVISDWGAITAVGPTGDIAVGFYHGQPCHACLWVFDANGALRWQRELDDPLGDHSAGLTYEPGGSLYAMAYAGWLYRYAADGTQLWRRQGVGGDPHGRFALDPAGRLFVAANAAGGAVLARLDPATGDDLWRIQRPSSGYFAGPTILSDGSISAQLDLTMYRVTPDSALMADTLPTPRAHYLSAADGRGYHYLSEAACSPCVHSLVAVGPDHTVRWQVGFPDQRPSEAVIDADTVIYAAGGVASSTPPTSEVKAIGPDGVERWTATVTGLSYSARLAVLADGSLLVAAGNFLHRLARGSGTKLDSLAFPATVQSALAVTDDATIYLVIADGRLLALQGWAGLEADAPWPLWRRDNRRTASVPRP